MRQTPHVAVVAEIREGSYFEMTTSSYSIGFHLADGYATRATIRLREADTAVSDAYHSVSLNPDAPPMVPQYRDYSSNDFFAMARPAMTASENTTTTGLRSGTHIRTTRGVAAVDFLTAGDEVVTENGSTRRVERVERRFAAADDRSSVTIRIARGALADRQPSQDLWVAPQQVLVVGGVAVLAANLVNGISIQPIHSADPAACFHVVLDQPALMLAEDTPVGSFAVNGLTVAAIASQEQVCRHVAVRAGAVDSPEPTPGPIRGYLEDCRPTRIAGWAQNTVSGKRAVHVVILLDGAVLAEVVANQWRKDLQDADIGDGHHGFEFHPTRPLAAEKLRGVKIICVADGTELHPVQGLAIP
jgi:hypothetical protein